MLDGEDIQTFAHLGRALWPNSGEGEPIAAEVLSAVALLDLNEERRTERAIKVLLDKAQRDFRPESRRLDSLFFRLDPRARFLLVAVQVSRWSYERAARVLGTGAGSVERELWSTRMALATQGGASLKAYPVGTDARGAHCPEYLLDRPWTQRFLDEEMPSGRERIFLQNHLMACDSCRRALSRCRDIYYAVDKLIPRMDPARPEDHEFITSLEGLERLGRIHSGGKSEITFGESLARFFSRREAQLLLAAIGALVVILFLRR